MILRDIGELLALLRALMLETEHILKMMDHLMNAKRKLERCAALPVFRQIDGMCGVVIEGQRIALRECRLLIVGGEPGAGKREQSPKPQRCNLRRRHEPQKGVLTDCRKIEFGRKQASTAGSICREGLRECRKCAFARTCVPSVCGLIDGKLAGSSAQSDPAIVIVRSATAYNDAFHMALLPRAPANAGPDNSNSGHVQRRSKKYPLFS